MLSLNNKVLDCPIYIATSNEWLPMLRPFAYLFNEFWSKDQKVTFLGYDTPDFELPSNFDFISLGPQRGISYWADDIRTILEECHSEYFIYTAEDQILTRPVNFKSLESLMQACEGHNPARAALTNTVSNQICKEFSENVVISDQNANYRLSLIWSIWRKDYFLKNLHPGYSPWNFEVDNMSIVKSDGEVILGCKDNFPLGHCNASQTRQAVSTFSYNSCKFNFLDVTSHPTVSKRSGLDPVYIDNMLSLGYITKDNL